MKTENLLFSFTVAALAVIFAFEFSIITDEWFVSEWQKWREAFGLFLITLSCVLPYTFFLCYECFLTPLEIVHTLAESQEKPANLLKRYKNSGAVPPPFPNGWFYIYQSHKLLVGDVKQISVLNNEYALYRGEDGAARLVSAFCPHLGANLAIGGEVHNNCITCPFHGWQFDGDTGKCVDIPYSKNIPKIAHTNPILTAEKNGVIYMWHHVNNEEPTWEVPAADGLGTWKFRCDGYSQHEICAHIQEIPENGADNAHLNILHTTPIVEFFGYFGFTHGWTADWNPLTGEQKHISEIHLTQCFCWFGKTIPCTTLNVRILQIGPGIVILQFNTMFGKAYVVQSVTPIEAMLQMTIHSVHMPWYIPRILGKGLLWGLVVQVERDVPIWNNKTFVNKPLLCKGDGKIAAFRRWYSQFYTEENILRAKQNTSILDW